MKTDPFAELEPGDGAVSWHPGVGLELWRRRMRGGSVAFFEPERATVVVVEHGRPRASAPSLHVTLGAGWACVLRPGEVGEVAARGDEAVGLWLLEVGLPPGTASVDERAPCALAPELLRALHAVSGGRSERAAGVARAAEALVAARAPLPLRSAPVLRALRAIEADLDRAASTAALAAGAGLSPSHLARTFHREVGASPHAYRIHARASRARAAIRAGAALSIVGPRCGFADQSHLTHWFRRLYGLTPGAYADAVRAAARRERPGQT